MDVLQHFWDNLTVTSAIDRNEQGEVPLLCRQMMDARGKKYALHEILWTPTDSGLTAEIQFVPLWFFENITGELRYLPSEGSVSGQPLDRKNWLISVGEGLMYACSVAWMYKNLPLKDWLIYSERHGMPGIHGTTPAPKGSTEWNALVEAVENFATDWSLVTGQGAEIKPVDLSATGELPYPPLVDRMSRALAAIWRGADLSTMSSGSAAGPGTGASLQGDEMSLLESGDAAWLSENLSRQVDRRVIEYAFGPGVKPLAYIVIKSSTRRDINSDIQVDEFLHRVGAPIGVKSLLERYQRSLPDPDDDVLPPPAAPLQVGPPAGLAVRPPPSSVANAAPAAGPADVASAAAPLFAAALAEDLAPVRERLETILDIEDPQFRDSALRNLQRDLPAILKAIAASPASARVLEDTLAAAVLNGMTDATSARNRGLDS
jgi:hypothetical protein